MCPLPSDCKPPCACRLVFWLCPIHIPSSITPPIPGTSQPSLRTRLLSEALVRAVYARDGMYGCQRDSSARPSPPRSPFGSTASAGTTGTSYGRADAEGEVGVFGETSARAAREDQAAARYFSASARMASSDTSPYCSRKICANSLYWRQTAE